MNGPERTRAAWRGLGALVFSLTAMAAAPAAARGQERAAGGKAEMEPLVSPWEPAALSPTIQIPEPWKPPASS